MLHRCDLLQLLFNCRLLVGVTGSGLISAMRKDGGGSLNVESVNQMVQVCLVFEKSCSINAWTVANYVELHKFIARCNRFQMPECCIS